uniref:Uncharacterized protein n=1 Tax=Eutreptiella gymnastica TaxID=73025 RepID=A0A7S1I3L0_9EUGL
MPNPPPPLYMLMFSTSSTTGGLVCAMQQAKTLCRACNHTTTADAPGQGTIQPTRRMLKGLGQPLLWVHLCYHLDVHVCVRHDPAESDCEPQPTPRIPPLVPTPSR